jgi:hypothetical protein
MGIKAFVNDNYFYIMPNLIYRIPSFLYNPEQRREFLVVYIHIVTCTPEERRYLVTARQQLRNEALLGNGWPQQYQGRVFYGVRSQAINPRERSSSTELS